jgi:putative transposase
VKYRCIDLHRSRFALGLMCRVLSVSRSGYYKWKSRVPGRRRQQEQQLIALIRELHARSRRSYGSPRIYRELRGRNVKCARSRVARLMRKAHLRGVAARRRKPRMPQVDRSPLPNLLKRDFSVGVINRAWTADLTYVRTREGWLFLAVVMDLGSRRVIGWAMSARPDTDLVIQALEMALLQRSPEPALIHHSDRGIHYTNARYRQMLADNAIGISYSGLGNCWDNAAMESFFHTLKSEEVRSAAYGTRREAKRRLFEYIEIWYNRKRRHSTLGHISPAEYEHRLQTSVH